MEQHQTEKPEQRPQAVSALSGESWVEQLTAADGLGVHAYWFQHSLVSLGWSNIPDEWDRQFFVFVSALSGESWVEQRLGDASTARLGQVSALSGESWVEQHGLTISW